jgi:hypothetical protein
VKEHENTGPTFSSMALITQARPGDSAGHRLADGRLGGRRSCNVETGRNIKVFLALLDIDRKCPGGYVTRE